MDITKKIKETAKSYGADLVGIASMDRFEGAPPQMDPRYIMPEAKSCIAMGFRVFRGSLRGIEEGTFFSNYSAMGYGGITYLYMPMTVINLCKVIEDMGYEALPMGHQSDWRAIDNEGALKPKFSRPVAPGKPAPDIMVHLRLAAFAAGLGEIGFSKMLLTPEFGPALRVGLVFTELELEPDPIYNGPQLCNKCMACVAQCPGGCFSRTKTVKVTVAGHELEWSDLNMEGCDYAFRGGTKSAPGKKGFYYDERQDTKPGWHSPFFKKPRNLYTTGQAVCGSRGCTRACLDSLEQRGVLTHKFHKRFKRNPPWSVDWSDYEALTGQTAGTGEKKETD